MRLLRKIFGSKPIVEKDTITDNYIAYYKNDLGIVAQGKSQKEALQNLMEDIKIVNEFKKTLKCKEQKSNSNHSIAHS